MDLLDYLGKHINLSEELTDKINTTFKYEYPTKGQLLLMPDNLSQKIIFVEKGLVRTYYIKNGKDITHLFHAENSFSLPIESVFYHRPSPYGWEALENSTIRSAQYRDIEPLLSEVDGLEKFMRLMLIDVLKIFSDRLYALQFQTAQDRYKRLIENQPDILLRAPLGHIASYLGITQQTLSVIRSMK